MTRLETAMASITRSAGPMRRAVPRLLPLLVLLAACGRGGPPPAVPTETWAPVAPVNRIFYDNASGIRDSTRLVIRDPGALADAWARATAGHAVPPPLPAVDFDREMVLVVGAGERSPDDRIRIDSVGVRTEGRGRARRFSLTAVVRLTRGCGGFAPDSYPVEFVRVQRVEGEVEWVERTQSAAACGGSS